MYLAGRKLHPVLIDEPNVEAVISKIGMIHPYPDTVNLKAVGEEIKSVMNMEKDRDKEILSFFFTDNNCDSRQIKKLAASMKSRKINFTVVPLASKGGNIALYDLQTNVSASGKIILSFDIGNFSNSPCEISLKTQATSLAGDRLMTRNEFVILNASSTKTFNKVLSLKQNAKLNIFFTVIDGDNLIKCDDGFGALFTYNKNKQGIYVGPAKYYPYFRKIFYIKNWSIAYFKRLPVNLKLPYPPIWIFHNSFSPNALKFLKRDSFFMVFGNSPFLQPTSSNADRIISFNGTHPFLRFCDFSDLSINTPYSIANTFAQLDQENLASTGNQNIISVMKSPQQGRILAFSFSLNSSNFLKTLSFPIIMENIYDFLKMKKGQLLLHYDGEKWFESKNEIPFLKPGNEKLYFKQLNLLDESESNINLSNNMAFKDSGLISRMKELFHQEMADIILYVILFFLLMESFVRYIKKRRYM